MWHTTVALRHNIIKLVHAISTDATRVCVRAGSATSIALPTGLGFLFPEVTLSTLHTDTVDVFLIARLALEAALAVDALAAVR